MFVLNWTFSIWFMILLVSVYSNTINVENERNSSLNEKSDAEKYYEFTVGLENEFKKITKNIIRQIMPYMLRLYEVEEISQGCIGALLKYSSELTKARVWAAEMLDATSKLPPGMLAGTFSDYGSFDECLNIEVSSSNSRNVEFRGRSCAVIAKPPMPPQPEKFTLVKATIFNPSDTLSKGFQDSAGALYHKSFQLIACVPSKCSLQDMQLIAEKASNMTGLTIKIPMCYVKEDMPLEPVHYAVLTILAILLVMVVLGTIADSHFIENNRSIPDSVKQFLVAFSFPTNLSRLMSASGGSAEMKCLHGIKAIGICWVILAHTYVFISFNLLKEPEIFKTWFSSLSFQLVHNSSPAVETFFIVSGILVSYGGMKSMEKVKGKFNIPLLIFRRYLRLTPSLLLVMGLVFFLPLISSGPFWYEQVDPQLESCRNYWWSTLLYISNWMGIEKGCLLHTWYMAANFQLYILSLILLMVIFRFTKIGLSLLVVCILISCAAVGVETVVSNLSATVLISTTDEREVYRTLSHVHIYTMSHLGPHCIGMILGYYIYKYKEKKLKMWIVIAGWCASATITLAVILGIHRFTTGDETSQSVIVLYASVHRCVFSVGVAWVAFACIAGYGGPVNSLLSHAMWAPLSRLTFMVYLLHPLVIWTRLGSLRERHVATHYEFVYSLLANIMTSFAVSVPFYLLLEAPLSNLNRMALVGRKTRDEETESKKQDFSNDAMDGKHTNFPTQIDECSQKTRM